MMVAIETDEELEIALEQIEALMGKENLTADEDLLLSELVAAAEEYEDIHYPIEDIAAGEWWWNAVELVEGIRRWIVTAVSTAFRFLADAVDEALNALLMR